MAGGADRWTSAPGGDPLGSSTEAIRAVQRDRDAISKEDAMTINSDNDQTCTEAIADIGPFELTDHYWAIVGSIPYDGHVVLGVSPTTPSWTVPRP